MRDQRSHIQGLTLIELSIVLVIIGLIVGGVLVGQDLIRAAGVRATIVQIEKYNQAANAFYGKYRYLPGDIPAIPAAQFGFAPRGQYPGQGDGNGILMGNYCNCSTGGSVNTESAGETMMFWVDLSAASLIEGNFSTASSTLIPSANVTLSSTPNVSAYIPPAKLGNGNYFYIASGVYSWNVFGLAAVNEIPDNGGFGGDIISTPALTVSQAYAIDKKIDDGLPQTGNVIATYMQTGGFWWAGGPSLGGESGPYFYEVPGDSTTCFDNGGVGGAAQQYSVEISNGSNVNCALTFKMQAGD